MHTLNFGTETEAAEYAFKCIADAYAAFVQRQSTKEDGAFRLLIAGGSVLELLDAMIATTTQEEAFQFPWKTAAEAKRVFVYFVDERFVDAATAVTDRNDAAFFRGRFFAASRIPQSNVFSAPTADAVPNLQAATEAYAAIIASVPAFDVALLGMGPDGHVASLFPMHAALRSTQETVAVCDAPKPPVCRVSLSVAAIRRRCSQLFFWVRGA